LETHQRLARWKVVVLKMLWVLESLSLKRRCQAALGEDNYRRMFQKVKEVRPQGNHPFDRLINGEVVGAPLKPGEGVPQVDPQMCMHPTSEMKRRGNKMKWWTCALCLSRWERSKLEVPAGAPTGKEVMLHGPQAGKTFREIHDTEHQYSHWVRLTAETAPAETTEQILRLAAYLQTRETQNAEGIFSDMEEEGEENDL